MLCGSRRGFLTVLSLRFTPIPMEWLNYFLSSTHVTFAPYTAATAVGRAFAPYTAATAVGRAFAPYTAATAVGRAFAPYTAATAVGRALHRSHRRRSAGSIEDISSGKVKMQMGVQVGVMCGLLVLFAVVSIVLWRYGPALGDA
eukprot:gene44492-24331_t